MNLSENGNFANIATTSGVYPKITLLPVLSQINTIKVKISDFQTRFHYVASCCFQRVMTAAG